MRPMASVLSVEIKNRQTHRPDWATLAKNIRFLFTENKTNVNFTSHYRFYFVFRFNTSPHYTSRFRMNKMFRAFWGVIFDLFVFQYAYGSSLCY